MPRKPAQPEPKYSLTIAQLAGYDDLLTSALIDGLYFWSTIRKNRPTKFVPPRGLPEDEIARIIRDRVIIEKDATAAEEELLRVSGLQKFVERLPNPKARDEFKRHLRKYINIYLPDCQWEVTTTNRYTIFQHEASVTARKPIEKGQTIKYLCGTQVMMTKDEEANMHQFRNDFSIVLSSRKKAMALFLGPARFANHDCNANARLMTNGTRGMTVVAARDIHPGEEITVTYGDDYFGVENCECLCRTCELKHRNGWAGSTDSERQNSAAVDDNSPSPYSFRRKRRYAEDSSASPIPEWSNIELPKRRKTTSRLHIVSTPEDTGFVASTDQASEIPPASGMRTPPSPLKSHTTDAKSTEEHKAEAMHPEASPFAVSEQQLNPQLAFTVFGPSSSELSDGFSAASHSTEITVYSHERVTDSRLENALSPPVSISSNPVELQVSAPKTMESTSLEILGTSQGDLIQVEKTVIQDTVLPSIELAAPGSDKMEIDPADAVNTAPSRATSQSSELVSTELKERVPGDYFTHPALLAPQYSAWVVCTVCDARFVQIDAYFTRAYCDRCERHSKLYGFVWPKTDKESKWDREERILDHRVVHKFISHKDEKRLKTGRSESEESAEPEEPPKRPLVRGRPRSNSKISNSVQSKGRREIRVKATKVRAVVKHRGRKGNEAIKRDKAATKNATLAKTLPKTKTTARTKTISRKSTVIRSRTVVSKTRMKRNITVKPKTKAKATLKKKKIIQTKVVVKKQRRILPPRSLDRRSGRIRKVRVLY